MKRMLLSLLAVLAACLTGYAQPVPVDTVPFRLGADRRMYVELRVNNDTMPFRFLVDTGATDVVLNARSPRVAGAVRFAGEALNGGANSTERVSMTDGTQRLRLGHTWVDSLRFIAIPYPPDAWDGVLGLSCLRRFLVRVSYAERAIYLYSPADSLAPAGAECLPMDYRLGVPVVPVRVAFMGEAYDVWLEVDTGSDRVIDLNTPFVERHGLRGRQAPFAISSLSGTTQTGGRLENVYFDSVSVGGLSLPRVPGALSGIRVGVQASAEMDGVMGSNFLQRFDQVYDFRRGRLYLTVNDRLYTPFYDFLVQ